MLNTQQASHWLSGSAGLNMPTHAYCFRRIILTIDVVNSAVITHKGNLLSWNVQKCFSSPSSSWDHTGRLRAPSRPSSWIRHVGRYFSLEGPKLGVWAQQYFTYPGGPGHTSFPSSLPAFPLLSPRHSAFLGPPCTNRRQIVCICAL